MAMNPMQQQMSPDMLMAMMTDPRASPQQRMAAMSALNTMKGGANAPAPPPQMTGDSTGVSTIDPAFMAAVRQEVMGQGPEAQPEIPQRQAAPEAPQDPTTQALMSGAADASRVAAMARGGAVRGYNEGGKTLLEKLVQNAKSANQEDYSFLNDRFNNRGYAPVNGDVTTLSDIAENLSGAEERAQAAADKFYAEGRGKDSPQFFKDLNTIANFTPNPATMLYRGAKAITDPVARYFTGSTAEPAAVPPEYTRAIAPEVASMPVPNYDLRGRAGTFGTDALARAEASAAAQAAPAAAQAPAPAVDPAVEAMNAQRQSESDAYKKRMEELLSSDQPLSSQDKYMALLKAGLGTMASASKPGATFLGSIGEGGMSGVQSLDELRKERAVNRMKQATLLQSQRSEDLASEDRKTTAGIQQQLANVQKGELQIKQAEAQPNSPENKLRAAQATAAAAQGQAALAAAAYSMAGVNLRNAGTTKTDNILSRAKALQAEAEESGNPISLDEAIQRQYKDTSSLSQKDLLTLAMNVIEQNPGVLAGKTPEEATAYIQNMAQGLLTVSPNSTSKPAPPPKLTPDQQANYDAAKKAINEEGRDRNAVLERLRASGTPTTGL